jgi:hypothetical protein
MRKQERDRMRAVLVVIAALAVGCGDGGRTARLQNQLDEQQKQIRELEGKLSSLAKAEALGLDEKCARQAVAYFKEGGYDKSGPFNGFTNHYNPELGECFILIQSLDTKSGPGRYMESRDLWGAYERKWYANYVWFSESGKKYWQVKPFMCQVMSPSGEKKVCQSADEFDELVKTYMGRGGL